MLNKINKGDQKGVTILLILEFLQILYLFVSQSVSLLIYMRTSQTVHSFVLVLDSFALRHSPYTTHFARVILFTFYFSRLLCSFFLVFSLYTFQTSQGVNIFNSFLNKSVNTIANDMQIGKHCHGTWKLLLLS